MKKLSLIAAVALLAAFSNLTAGFAQTSCPNPSNTNVRVTAGALGDWAIQQGPGTSVSFVSGPATPPLGTGSAEFKIGADGDQGAELRNGDYAGTKLSDLTALSYWTYVTSNNGGQAPYLILNIDNNGDGSTDDLLFFEPVYQSGIYSGETVPNQCAGHPLCVATGTWQQWDALAGGWWSLNAFTFGPPLTTLAAYAAANPDATIVNSTSGGGVRIVTGYGAGPWDNFQGNADAFTIGVNCANTTYNFEVGPSSAAQCKKDGWKTFSNPAFKNQGDCIQFVNAGK